MAISEHEREWSESFLSFIEGLVADDDRYGEAMRVDAADESTLALRFAGGSDCWLEVVLHPSVPQLYVAFVTSDATISEEITAEASESGTSVAALVGGGFAAAGLDWPDPPVEHLVDDQGLHCFLTQLVIEDIVDLDLSSIRDGAARMLEGYLVAFGPAMEEAGGDEDWDDEE